MSLAGRGIVVTRPSELARNLARLIEEARGHAILFPAIQIEDLPQPGALRRLVQFDLAIFISPTAVGRAMRHAASGPPNWPRVAAVGAGTKLELESRGIEGVIAPEAGADSEALLALPEMQRMAGKRVIIVRGEGGREFLGDALRERGARVEYAECYRRVRPAADALPLLQAWTRVHAVTVSSEEGLRNLFALLGAQGAERLRATPLFVPHPRDAASAAGLGVREPVVGGPGDGEMFERLVAYFAQ